MSLFLQFCGTLFKSLLLSSLLLLSIIYLYIWHKKLQHIFTNMNCQSHTEKNTKKQKANKKQTKLQSFFSNMLKPSHKNLQNTRLKRMVKYIHRNNLKEPNMTNISFTQPAWAQGGSICFDFRFELRQFPDFWSQKRKTFCSVKNRPISFSKQYTIIKVVNHYVNRRVY